MGTKIWTLGVLMALASIAILYCYRLKEQKRVFGRYNAQQIADQTESVRQLLPDLPAPLVLTAEPFKTTPHPIHGNPKRVWLAEYSLESGRHLLSVAWNADTGELWEINHDDFWRQRASEKPLSQEEAVALGEKWILALEAGHQPQRWRFLSSERYSRKWQLRWRSDTWRIVIEMDANTHDLMRYVKFPDGDGAERSERMRPGVQLRGSLVH